MFGSRAVSTRICLNTALPTLQANPDALTIIIFRGKKKKPLSAAQRLSTWGMWSPPTTASVVTPLPSLWPVPALCGFRPSPSLTVLRVLSPRSRACPYVLPSLSCCSILEVSCRIYLRSFSLPHCSSHVQQNNYILAQKNEQSQSFCPYLFLPPCLFSSYSVLFETEFSLKHFSNLPISSPHF